ncbi:hypothetical protein ACHWQZ_G004254 [Mnemiopsis leidyi]
MSGEVSLPRRKSAQRANESLKKFVAFHTNVKAEESDSDGFVGDLDESSSEDGSEGVDSNEEGDNADEELSDDLDVVVDPYSRKRALWDTKTAYADIMQETVKLYRGKMSFLRAADIEAVEHDEQINIAVNGERLPALSSIDSEESSVGYAGGTVFKARWIPDSQLVCLAVCNSTHIVNYKSPVVDSIQIWSYDSNHLKFLYSLKVSVFYNLIVYPFRNTDSTKFTICIGCKNCVKMFRLPTTISDGSKFHFLAKNPSFQLNISPRESNIDVVTMKWAFLDKKLRLLGGLSNGYIVVWDLSRYEDGSQMLLPSQKVWAHQGHKVTAISVCPQMQNLFCSTSQDSRMKFWDLKNFRHCIYSQTRPQKQLLMPAQVHWPTFWQSILILSLMPVSESTGGKNKVHANSNIWQMSTVPLNKPSDKPTNLLNPRIFSEDLRGIPPRCFDFCDANSVMAVGFQTGLVSLLRVNNICINKHVKENFARSGHFLYLCVPSATPKSAVNISKEFKDDQDFLNHFEFTLPTKLASSIPSGSTPITDISKKLLNSVTHVELQKSGTGVFVGYMSGLFQIVTPPDSLFDPKSKV